LANGSLTIQPVTEEDAGDFLCLARNRAGEDFARLRVDVLTRSPARIQRKRLRSGHQEDEEEDEEEEEEVAVVYGGHLRMDCVASGLPDPDITWALPDGTMLNADPKLRQARNRRYAGTTSLPGSFLVESRVAELANQRPGGHTVDRGQREGNHREESSGDYYNRSCLNM